MIKRIRKFLVIALISIYASTAYGQSNVELNIQLLTPDLIGEVTLDQKPFFDWVNRIKDEIEEHLKDEEGNKKVIVLISMHKEKSATIKIGAKPKLSKTSTDKLLNRINKHKSPRTKIIDYSFAMISKLNDGCSDTKMKFTPNIIFPDEERLSKFEKLSLADKKIALQDWVIHEVIPVTAKYETTVDPKFKGVLTIGDILKQEKYLNVDIDKLTEKSYDYWRATMEMSQGNQLIPFSKMCMHIANGEFDIATSLLFVINLFSDPKSLPAIYYSEISAKLNLINRELSAKINKGISLHDKGKDKEAVEYYKALLATFPKSAWLNYELYFSKIADIKDINDMHKEWEKSKKIIYKYDPMYHMDVHASTGREGYLLFRRQEINTLFQTKDNFKKDFVKYADIAFELGNYGFASQLYWLILSYIPSEDYDNRNIVAYYLYGLDKLGIKNIAENFKGDFPTEYKKIETERKRIMEESSIYQSFRNGE